MSNSIFNSNDGKQTEVNDKVDTHSKAILTVTQRQKDLEASIELISEKLNLFDHNSIKNFRKVNQDVKDLRSDVKELKEEITSIKEFNSKMSKQIRLMTTKDEVQKLEKYIDLWDPMNFLTRGEMDDFRTKIKSDFEEIIDKFLHEKN